MSEVQQAQDKQVIIIQQAKGGMSRGALALTFSIIALFVLPVIFIPLSLMSSAVAIYRKQYALGILSIIICGIAFMISPMLLMIVAGIFGGI